MPDNFSQEHAVIYFKSILAGLAASAVVVIIFVVIAIAVMPYFPQLALRIFPIQRHELGWGGFYAVDLPEWPSDWPPLLAGTAAFAGGFYWTFRRSRTGGAR